MLMSGLNNEWKCLDMHSFDDSKNPEVVEIPSENLFADEFTRFSTSTT